ncbi:Mercuric ion reductase [Hyphomicrobium sulfonivorans]|uniref:Mercuric ion reductase n=2 Tax=Hyphomicrobium sulfonivorans TaxID=121290 RepID=A0A120CXI3_HYPSL|nr:Mercuric ion reductase [Hyphomicrobium sulfonivorans]
MEMAASQSGDALVNAPEEHGEIVNADIGVIGAGPAGLAVATSAAALGRTVVLVEGQRFGGQALNSGCIPRRALAASAARAHAIRTAGMVGITGAEPVVDMRAVHAYISSASGKVAPNFAPERFAGLGVRVIQASGRFIDRRTLLAGEYRIKARRFVIATGTTPSMPEISGLQSTPYFTTDSILENIIPVHSLIVIGGSAAGLEIAQAYSRLGANVIVLNRSAILPEEDGELTQTVFERLAEEGIGVHQNANVDAVEGDLGRVRVKVSVNGEQHVVEGSHLLIAAERKPAIDNLGLDVARIRHDANGLQLNSGLRTSNRRVFAVGAVTGSPLHAHTAEHHAAVVISRALMAVPASVDTSLLARAVFTEPEFAYVGLTEDEAKKRNRKIHVLRWPYRENERAQAEGIAAGHVKVVTTTTGRILGAGIAGASAGELIQPWALAIARGLDMKAMVRWNLPSPTLGEINKRVASSYYAANLASPALRKFIGLLAKIR